MGAPYIHLKSRLMQRMRAKGVYENRSARALCIKMTTRVIPATDEGHHFPSESRFSKDGPVGDLSTFAFSIFKKK